MNRIITKVLSILLSIVMVAVFLPVNNQTVYADGTRTTIPSGGSGALHAQISSEGIVSWDSVTGATDY